MLRWQQDHVTDWTTLAQRRRWRLRRAFARQVTLASLTAVRVAGWIGRRRRPVNGSGCEVMLTGRFDADNWILAHLGPLAASRECSRLWMVSSNPVPLLPKVVAIYPPQWLKRIVGGTAARLLVLAWSAVRKRPHIVGGFHITFNGMAAAIVARLAGARSLYFCVGGPAEVQDGGVHADDHAFAKMKMADATVEKRLIGIVSQCDMVVTMGTRAATFFANRGVKTAIHVVSGGIDAQRFQLTHEIPSIDLILTGRLARIKRMDVFLQAVREVATKIPDVKAVIVGDGPLREELPSLSMQLGIDRNVEFVGRQRDVEDWLRRAKIFVLTSDSEGLSLALMEAMMCGLPAVVSDVGDLGDLVENGVNGYLVPRRSPELFAERIAELLLDGRKRAAFSQAARRSALRYETQATVGRWDSILAGLFEAQKPIT
jgi:glycosyltransferase involved in cell wall biosynthesis